MNTLKWNQTFSALGCLTLLLTLSIGNVNASPTLQGVPQLEKETRREIAAVKVFRGDEEEGGGGSSPPFSFSRQFLAGLRYTE